MEAGYRLSSVGSLDSRSGLVHFTLMVKVFPLASLKNDKRGIMEAGFRLSSVGIGRYGLGFQCLIVMSIGT
jgi:hypothetical protein